MHHVHTGEAVVTMQKFDIFSLVDHHKAYSTLRTVCMHPICVGELVMDAGQPLVTSN